MLQRLLARFRPVPPQPMPHPDVIWRDVMHLIGYVEWCDHAPPDGADIQLLRRDWDAIRVIRTPPPYLPVNGTGLFWMPWLGTPLNVLGVSQLEGRIA